MSLEDLGNLGEFVGAIGVVVSLVYLAYQIRQNTAAVRASTHQAMIDYDREQSPFQTESVCLLP